MPANPMIQYLDEESAFSPAVWDAMTDLMAYGRGVMPLAVDLARPGAERTVIRRSRPAQWWYEKPMFTLKDDDPQITWDHKAMAARPFRERKD